MGVFKKIFSFGKKSNHNDSNPGKVDANFPGFKETVGHTFKEIVSDDYFNKRYKGLEEKDNVLLDGSVKMIESFFIEKLLKPPIDAPINHPENLDFAVTAGYLDFAKLYSFGTAESATHLAFAFSKYMIDHNKMTFYFDAEPEYKYRMFTLKKDINKILISLYPLEYCLKVLSKEKKFMEIVQRINEQESNLPQVPDILKKYTS
jgi:hypothetical protein